MINNGELFIQNFWPVIESKPPTESMSDKLFKLKNSIYYPGGSHWQSGRSRWRRPCFSNQYRFIYLGDSQLRQFYHGDSKYDEKSICSFGGCDFSFGFSFLSRSW